MLLVRLISVVSLNENGRFVSGGKGTFSLKNKVQNKCSERAFFEIYDDVHRSSTVCVQPFLFSRSLSLSL